MITQKLRVQRQSASGRQSRARSGLRNASLINARARRNWVKASHKHLPCAFPRGNSCRRDSSGRKRPHPSARSSGANDHLLGHAAPGFASSGRYNPLPKIACPSVFHLVAPIPAFRRDLIATGAVRRSAIDSNDSFFDRRRWHKARAYAMHRPCESAPCCRARLKLLLL